jgi:serine/threonine protein kinase
LAHLHENDVTHRDIKMENILMDQDYNLKITDFGFAGPTIGSQGKGKSVTTVGTLSMMSPE